MTPHLATRPIGDGISVTEIGFGAASIGNLGRATSHDQALGAVDEAWAGGIRYFDTAPHYGLGLSELRLGEALRGRRRAEYTLSTKVGRLLVPNPNPAGSDLAQGFDVPDDLVRVFDFSADGVHRSLESSLIRLGTDRIDIALIHDPDDHVRETLDEAIPALQALKAQGVVGAIGLGMNQWQVPLAILKETDLDVVMLAGRWTLLDRSGEALVNECDRRGISVLAASPFNSGILARPGPTREASYDHGEAPDSVVARARELDELAGRHGALLPQAALQFPLQTPSVASVVVGMRTPEEVRSNLELFGSPVAKDYWQMTGGLPACP